MRNSSLTQLEKELKKIHSKVCSILNVVDQYIISSLIKKNVKAMVKSTILTIEKKFCNLTQSTVLPFTRYLSSSKLTDEEMNILRCGLKHSIEPNFINKTDILSSLDFIHQTMSKDLKDQKDTGEVKAKISYLANTYVNSYKPTKKTLRKHKILKKLRNNNNILITKPGKENGVAIVDRIHYMSSMYEIVNDSSKFLKSRSYRTICRENKLQRFLRSLENKDFFNKDVYDNIYPCGSKPARIYGNHKTHKLKSKTDKLTFRPIVSSIGTYNYKLAKFLGELLNPTIPSQYCATDSFSLCKEIQEVSAFNKFTNIPLKETIKLAVKLIFEKRPEIKITRKQLTKLFEFATSGTHFLFNGNYYDQIDGVAMGSSLGPVLPNLFIGYVFIF